MRPRPTRLATPLVLLSLVSGFAMADPPGGSGEPLLAKSIQGLQKNTDLFTGKQGWKLVYRQRTEFVGSRADTGVESIGPAKATVAAGPVEVNEWTVTVIRQGNDIIVHKDRPNGPRASYAWAGGIGAQISGGMATVTPSGSVGIFQATRYLNQLFIDISPEDLVWDQSTQGVMAASRPSELFVWALPRTIILHKSEFAATQDEKSGRVRLKRKDHDDIELDPKLNYACIRRRYEFKPGVPLFEVENKDYFKAAPGYWLPRVQTVKQYYSPPASPTIYGKVIALERNELVSFQLNKFKAEDFLVDMTKAGRVEDLVRKVGYRKFPKETTPEEALDTSIREAIGSGAFGAPENSSSYKRVIFLNCIVFCVVLIWIRNKHLAKLKRAQA
jgi:hypothetical protein